MKNEINFPHNTISASIWSRHVPVIVDPERKITTAFITDEIREPSHYAELCYHLNNAVAGTTVELHINTPGGIIDSAFMVINAIAASKAHVVAVLSGTVASAGTMIAMACDQLRASPHLSFMIHNYSGGLAGKGHEMKARQRHVDEHLNEAFRGFYGGFLTDEEMSRVIDGTDLWMGASEVTERWLNRAAYLKAA